MTSNVVKVLERLKLPNIGNYEDNGYLISLENSNEYAKYYTILTDTALNVEYPDLETNTNGNTLKIVNKFEASVAGYDYLILLTADFQEDKYSIYIQEV